MESIEQLNESLKKKSPQEILQFFIKNYKNGVILSSSMGAEDQVLTDMLLKIDDKVRIFTLDTGRLFPETYEIIDKTNKHYNIKIEIFFPDKDKIEKMVNDKGINLFYDSVENRKLCCNIRKIEPAKRALKGMKVWISGLRKGQSVERFFTKLVEWDEENKILKVNPLLNWTEKQVWSYVKENNVPYNKLHDKGFTSIGCQPCTRAVKEGEDFRSGRWWWEETHKECGLHVKNGNSF